MRLQSCQKSDDRCRKVHLKFGDEAGLLSSQTFSASHDIIWCANLMLELDMLQGWIDPSGTMWEQELTNKVG